MKYRKKPVVIDAVQWLGSDVSERVIADFFSEAEAQSSSAIHWRVIDQIFIRTLEGTIHADVGDWIIKGVKGEFYPCKPDIFQATYELVNEDTSIPADYADSAE